MTIIQRPKTPGETLNEMFLKPLGITQQELAERLGITRVRLNEILLGKRSISMDTAIRLARFFNNTVEYWIGLQSDVDKWEAIKYNKKEYDKIIPLKDKKNKFIQRFFRMDLKIKDIVDLLKVPESKIKEWIDNNEIPHYKVKKQYFFNKAEINEWILKNKLEVSDKILDMKLTSKPVIISGLVIKGGIHYGIKGKNVVEVIKDAIGEIPIPPDITKEEIETSLIERESMMTTAVGRGIAFPHPRNPIIGDVDSEQISLCLLEKPVDFQALDGRHVHTLFIIISSNPKRHLEILSKLSYLCQHTDFINVIEDKKEMEIILNHIQLIEKEWSNR